MNAVVTGSWGEAGQAMTAVSRPFLVRYAARVGAAYVELADNLRPGHPIGGKFQAARLLDNYDRILWVDADAIVRPDCPDLFALAPAGVFAAYDELERAGDVDAWLRCRSVVEVCETHGWSVPDLQGRYYNAGVYLAGRRHRPILSPLPGRDDDPWHEQSAMNARLAWHGERVLCLPECFNTRPYHNAPRHWHETAFIVHFAGPPDSATRIEDMKHLAAQWEKIAWT